jgi:hypothetical protein
MKQPVKLASVNWGHGRLVREPDGSYLAISAQAAAYLDAIGRLPPPNHAPGSIEHAQWTYRKDRRKPSAEALTLVE